VGVGVQLHKVRVQILIAGAGGHRVAERFMIAPVLALAVSIAVAHLAAPGAAVHRTRCTTVLTIGHFKKTF